MTLDAILEEAGKTVQGIVICLGNCGMLLDTDAKLADGYLGTAHEESIKLTKLLERGLHKGDETQ